MRTLSPSSICHPACASAVCAATAAATASSTDSNTAANESPAMENDVPPCSWIAVLIRRSCWARSAAIASVCCAHSRVDPTMSVKRNTPSERPCRPVARGTADRPPPCGRPAAWAGGRSPRRWPGRGRPARATVRSPPPRRAGSGRSGTAAGLRSGVPDCASARISWPRSPSRNRWMVDDRLEQGDRRGVLLRLRRAGRPAPRPRRCAARSGGPPRLAPTPRARTPPYASPRHRARASVRAVRAVAASPDLARASRCSKRSASMLRRAQLVARRGRDEGIGADEPPEAAHRRAQRPGRQPELLLEHARSGRPSSPATRGGSRAVAASRWPG